ncbi:nucleotide disphospho-sugar-binding domain-containing protein [Streptomyces sp. NPDC048301]|uniref:glycosyltransferase n=1 Tax=unclassified Streptomyces TaxID=2593676 RepID=UPI00341905FB
MRVLFTARHSLPHLLAMTAAARACTAAGHEVRATGPEAAGPEALPEVFRARPPAHGFHADLVVSGDEEPGDHPGAVVVRWTPLDRHPADGRRPPRIDPCPPHLRADADRDSLALRQPTSHPGLLPPGLRTFHRPLRVCLRPGTPGAGGWTPDRLRRVARAALGLDVEVIVPVPAAERHRLGVSGPRVLFAEPRLLGPVLATCVAVVHEGGPDVTLEAAAHGVPQLVLTDARPPGDRLAMIGAGRRLVSAENPDETSSTLRLRRHIAELLYDGRALAAARRLSTAIADLSPPEAFADRLRELTDAR